MRKPGHSSCDISYPIHAVLTSNPLHILRSLGQETRLPSQGLAKVLGQGWDGTLRTPFLMLKPKLTNKITNRWTLWRDFRFSFLFSVNSFVSAFARNIDFVFMGLPLIFILPLKGIHLPVICPVFLISNCRLLGRAPHRAFPQAALSLSSLRES